MKKYKDVLYDFEIDPIGDQIVKRKIVIKDLLSRDMSYKLLNIILHNCFHNVESYQIIETYLDHENKTLKISPLELARELMSVDNTMYMQDSIFNYVEKVLDDSYNVLNKMCSAYELASLYYFDHYNHVNYKKAFKYLKKGVDDGSFNSEELLGKFYLEGIGVRKNYKKAFKHLIRCAILSESPLSLYLLGDMYLNGYGIKKDKMQANSLYMKAYDICLKSTEDPLIEGEVLIRLAKMHMGFKVDETDYSHYIIALKFYQYAEIEFNKAIDLQHSVAKNRLIVAIKGQKKARKKIFSLRKNNEAVYKVYFEKE